MLLLGHCFNKITCYMYTDTPHEYQVNLYITLSKRKKHFVKHTSICVCKVVTVNITAFYMSSDCDVVFWRSQHRTCFICLLVPDVKRPSWHLAFAWSVCLSCHLLEIHLSKIQSVNMKVQMVMLFCNKIWTSRAVHTSPTSNALWAEMNPE